MVASYARAGLRLGFSSSGCLRIATCGADICIQMHASDFWSIVLVDKGARTKRRRDRYNYSQTDGFSRDKGVIVITQFSFIGACRV